MVDRGGFSSANPLLSRETFKGAVKKVTTISGGGGGGSTPTQSIAPEEKFKQEARARAAETQRKQVQIALAQAKEAESQRASRIEQGTIQGQFSNEFNLPEARGVTDSRFMATPEVQEFRGGRPTPFRESFGSASGRFVEETGRAIAGLGGAIIGSNELSDIDNPLDTFKFVGRQRGEFGAVEQQFGGDTSISPLGFFVRPDTRTKFEVSESMSRRAGVPESVIGLSTQAQQQAIATQEVGRVRAKFTGLVQSGDLTSEEATSQAQAEFETSFSARASQLPQVDLSIRTGETAGKVATTGIVTTGLIAGSVFSPTFAAALGGTSIAAAGQFSVKSGQEFSRGEFLQSGISLGQAGLFAASGGSLITGALGPGGTLPRQITQLRIQELQAQPLKLKGVEFAPTEGESILVAGGLRRTSFARQELEFLAPTFRTGTTEAGLTKFSITGGRGVSRTAVVDFGRQGIVPVQESIISSTEAFSFTARGTSGLKAGVSINRLGVIATQSLDDVTASFGTLDIIRGSKRTKSSFGGISKTDDSISKIISGRGSKLRIERGVDIGPSGELSFIPRSVRFKPSSAGEIIKITPDSFSTAAQSFDDISFNIGSGRGSRAISGLQAPSTTQVSDIGSSAFQSIRRSADIIKPSLGTTPRVSVQSTFPAIVDIGGLSTSQFSGFGGASIVDTVQVSPGRDLGFRGFQIGGPELGIGTGLSSKTIVGLDVLGDSRSKIKTRAITSEGFTQAQPQDLGSRSVQISKTTLKFKTQNILRTPTIPTQPFEDFGFAGAPSAFGAPGAFKLPGLPTERPERKRRTKGKKKTKSRVATSLTGTALFDFGGITGKLPKGGNPFAIRFRPGKLI